MMHMQVNVTADCHRGSHGYEGAVLKLPATPYEIEDALQRAHVPEGGGYELHRFEGFPSFLKNPLILSGQKSLEEMSLLADVVGRMDEIEFYAYEGAIQLCQDEKGDVPVTTKELINLAFDLDNYEFHPGVTDDRRLGEVCIMGGMLDLVDGLPDETAELIDPVKAGEKLREADHGAFTPNGYIYRSSTASQEAYDGKHLPVFGEKHSGLLSLRIEKCDDMDADSGVWLELPADESAMQWALTSIGEPSFDSCRIAETKSIIPAFQYQLAGNEDIGELNTLAERLAAFPNSSIFMKYKAALELEQCSGLGMALDIAANLDCYDYSPDIVSMDAFGEYVLQSAGIDTEDPAFKRFDFGRYGERQLEKAGYVFTSYGAISRNGQEFVHEYTRQAQEAESPRQGMSMGQ